MCYSESWKETRIANTSEKYAESEALHALLNQLRITSCGRTKALNMGSWPTRVRSIRPTTRSLLGTVPVISCARIAVSRLPHQ